MTDHVIAIDVGGTKISSGIVDRYGNVEGFTKIPTDPRGQEYVIKQIADLIVNFLNVSSTKDLLGVGITIPGIVNKNIVVSAPNIKGWKNLDLERTIKNILQRDISIYLIDDRVAGALGERWCGNARNKQNIIFIIIGTGVGAGLVIQGKPYSGFNGAAGSVGWMIIDRTSINYETKKGILEEIIAGPSIVKRFKKAIREFSKSGRDLMGNSSISPDKIFQMAKSGNEVAKQIIEDTITYIAICISNVVTILNPEIIIVDGGVGREIMKNTLYIKKIRSIVNNFAQPYSRSVEIMPSKLGDRAYLLGAAKWVFSKN